MVGMSWSEGRESKSRVPGPLLDGPGKCWSHARIFWNILGNGANGYTAYREAGWGARHGEKEKWRNWNLAIKRRQERSTLEVQFVPFSVEVGGAWGPAAKRFFNTCVQLGAR
eukprot:COSAG02_NODE_6982_length_3249_cov_1.873968_3_plen_112_part_00